MDINGISSGTAPKTGGYSGGGNAEAQISNLEHKLKQLGDEKEKAIKSKDQEKAQKIQKQIEQIQRQIERLKQKGNESPEKVPDETSLEDSGNISLPPSSVGQYVDETA